LRFEACQPRELLASDVTLTGAAFQNQIEPLDVNADGLIEALDALLITNALNARGVSSFPASDLVGLTPVEYLDVDGNDLVSQADFDAIANFLNCLGARCGSRTPTRTTIRREPPGTRTRSR
jgi:hypothetical protein